MPSAALPRAANEAADAKGAIAPFALTISSDQAAGGHADGLGPGHDDVVQEPHVDLVARRWLGHRARVIVARDDRARVEGQGLLRDHPRMHGGAIEGAVRTAPRCESGDAGSQEQEAEHLAVAPSGFPPAFCTRRIAPPPALRRASAGPRAFGVVDHTPCGCTAAAAAPSAVQPTYRMPFDRRHTNRYSVTFLRHAPSVTPSSRESIKSIQRPRITSAPEPASQKDAHGTADSAATGVRTLREHALAAFRPQGAG